MSQKIKFLITMKLSKKIMKFSFNKMNKIFLIDKKIVLISRIFFYKDL